MHKQLEGIVFCLHNTDIRAHAIQNYTKIIIYKSSKWIEIGSIQIKEKHPYWIYIFLLKKSDFTLLKIF